MMDEKMPEENSIFGYKFRDLFDSEREFFRENPSVAGMATEDNRIILNPFSGLSDEEMKAVAVNEAVRLYMRNENVVPDFDITEDQMSFFKGTPYEGDLPSVFPNISHRASLEYSPIFPTLTHSSVDHVRQPSSEYLSIAAGSEP